MAKIGGYFRAEAIPAKATCLRCSEEFEYMQRTNKRRYCETCAPLHYRDVDKRQRLMSYKFKRRRFIKSLVRTKMEAVTRRQGCKPIYKDAKTNALYRKDGPKRFVRIPESMMHLLVCLLLMLVAGQSRAEDVLRPPGNVSMSVLQPPKRFNHPYRGKTIEYLVDLSAAHFLCGKNGVDADSCSWTRNKVCYIVIPSDGPVKDRSQYRYHEIAHCNGWGARHEK